MSTGIFCKHKWKLLSEITTKSRLDVLTNNNTGIDRGSESLLKRKHIQLVTCEKCGKLKRFVEVL